MLKFSITFPLILLVFLITAQNRQPVSMSNFETKIEGAVSTIDQIWFAPLGTVGSVGKYNKLEVGFKLDKDIENQVEAFIGKKGKGINPFDPAEIDVSIKLTDPNGKVINTNGFYFMPYFNNPFKNQWVADTTSFKWRLRFAPNEIGKWKAEVVVIAKGFTKQKSAFEFTCVTSNHKGVLRTSQTGTNEDRYLYQSETNKTFVPIGHNLTTRGENVTPIKNELHKKWIKELGTNGGNFFRMEMPAGGALPDWPVYNDYSGKLGKMFGYDEVVDLAEELEMYFIMFRHHVEVDKHAEWGLNWDCWDNNPYKKAFKLTTSEGYFSNQEIIRHQNNTLRYIMARWGYSPSFAFYGFSEVNNWTSQIGLDKKATFNLFADWFVGNKKYIADSTHFLGGLYVNSFTSNLPLSRVDKSTAASRLIDESDVIAIHTYNLEKWANYKTRYNFVRGFSKEWKNSKPVFIEEIGLQLQDIYCCTGIDFHNNIWSNAFMGSMCTGMHWSWDRGIHDQGYYVDYNNLYSFFKGEDLRSEKYKEQRWKDDGRSDMKKTRTECFSLVSEDKERVLGWVHNATFYWRNMNNTNTCLQQLIDSGKVENPCELEDKSGALGSRVDPWANYSNSNFLDGYSDKEGAIEDKEPASFIIKGLNGNGNRIYNPWAKKHWYKISYYTTHGKVNQVPIFTETLSTSIMGKLKPKAPLMDSENPDYSYKIEYVGFYKKITKR